MKTYLDLLRQILEHGEPRADRTGVGTLSLFGLQARYDLREGFPLVTTKKVLFSSVVKELLWFLRGETNIATLGCGIWDAWAREDGELGPIYGHQWRFWGKDEGRPGIDQIAAALALLRRDPTSRRNLVSAWNVEALPDMALAPCHTFFQLHVSGQRLDLQLYQRSADMALGVPFNIASYALLQHFFAAAAGLEPGFFVHTLGDAHIYSNHVDGIRKQLTREPLPLPTLRLLKTPDFTPEGRPGINLTEDDIVLEGYEHHPFIRFPVAV
jgi:thymidylate synthase